MIEDDEEHMWKVKNIRTNEMGLIPATLVRMIDGDLSKMTQRSSLVRISFLDKILLISMI